MSTRWISRLTFGGAGLWMFWISAQSYTHAGLEADTIIPAAIGLVMMVLAVTARVG